MISTDRALALRPIFSETYDLKSSNPLLKNGMVIYRVTDEERTTRIPDYLGPSYSNHIHITEESDDSFTYNINSKEATVSIVNEIQVIEFLKLYHNDEPFYLDITGLSHHIWAVLLKTCFKLNIEVKVLYAEPETYIPNTDKPYSYDLSQNLKPIKSIPGFVVLRSVGSSKFSFIPLLGFERRRFDLMFTSVDPPQYSIFPIIGVPGFQMAFPFETYLVNRKRLLENGMWHNIRFAAANCPFRLYYTLLDIHNRERSELYKVALIGTKPHALGAVLFYLCSGLTVELLYDHPTRKKGRTSGAYKLHIYHTDKFKLFLQGA